MPRTLPISLAVPGAWRADRWTMGCFRGESPPIERLPAESQPAAREAIARQGWEGRRGQVAHAAVAERGLLSVHGLGSRQELSTTRLQSWLAAVVEEARAGSYPRLLLVVPEHDLTRGEAGAERIGRWLATAPYRYDRYRDESPDRLPELEEIELLPPEDQEDEYRRGLGRVLAVAEAELLARELANTPGNEATPEWMAEQARKIAAEHGLDITVLGPEEMRHKGMGGLLAVGAGSRNEPRLVRLELAGQGPAMALVGKGVTFDTGGVSLKPAKSMEDMRFDKSGACTVLATAQAAARLGLRLTLRVYLPLAENMPGGSAYRPGDIVRCYSGKTVEIINTDAEGRMILADALAWAAEEGPRHLVELSTLTGAAVVSLGHLGAALYTPSDELAGSLLAAADNTGQRLWRMPLWPEFVEQMKGTHADLKNSGSRWGGANTAAAFLSQFVGSVESWAHLDIAGVAYTESDERASEATGFGVALLADWLQHLS